MPLNVDHLPAGTLLYAAPPQASKPDAARPHADGAQQWVSVKERLPEPKARVLFFSRGVVSIGFNVADESNEWIDELCVDNCGEAQSDWDTTHWMPLPAAPDGEVSR